MKTFSIFSRLFKNLAKQQGLVVYRIKNNIQTTEYTHEFKLWCYKLDDLTDDEMSHGLTVLEDRIESNSSKNEKTFTPSYAEFKGMCIVKQEVKNPIYRSWAGLPRPQMSNDDRKDKMAELRKNMGL